MGSGLSAWFWRGCGLLSQPDQGIVPLDLRRDAQRFLFAVARERDGLFPYSTRVGNGGYINDFRHAGTLRYTINSLLGLQAAARRDPDETDVSTVEALTTAFLDHHADRVWDPADLG